MSPDLDLLQPFQPGPFKDLGHRVVDLLAEHLETVSRRQGPVLPSLDPEASLRDWPGDFPAQGTGDPLALLERVIRDCNHLHHPRYVGHQVSSPLPWSALVDFASALLNNGSAIYEMGPVSTAMEQAVVGWFAGRIGWDPARADGILTHGGSAGNLTALLAARQHATPYDVWEDGVRDPGRLCILTSDQAHYSVRRSAQVMGLGGRNVIAVPSDDRFRMRADALGEALGSARREGRIVLAVVASVGSTATGAVDPFEPIADLCGEHGVWLHADGAHGGAMVVSDRLRERVRGLERADSIIIDAHKMLLAPALATLVVFRDGRRSFETFSQQAGYLFEGQDPTSTWYDLAQRTLECTKRSLGLQVYASLKVLGTDYFARYNEAMFDLGTRFAAMIRERPGWELAVEPDGNIVCFRYAPAGLADPDAFQSRAREALVREGSFYLVKTTLRDRTWLRCTLINPRTDVSDLAALLDRVQELADQG